MGLIKTMVFRDEAYHKITRVELHLKKRQMRVRAEIYENHDSRLKDQSMGIETEYLISEKQLKATARKEAEKRINIKGIKKFVAAQIIKIEKEDKKKLSKQEKDLLLLETTENEIAKKINEVAEIKIDKMIKDISEKSILKIGYEYLKQLKDFEDAIDK